MRLLSFPPVAIGPFRGRDAALFTALLVYGLAGSPTPDRLSWIEILIGVLLVAAIGLPTFWAVFTGRALWRRDDLPVRRLGTGLLLLSLYPALLVGFLSGHRLWDMIRDVIPLGFFFLWVFLVGRDVEKPLLYGLVAVGVLYALRFWPESGLSFARIGQHRGDDQLLYLTSSPAVLFAGLYLLYQGASLQNRKLWQRALMLVCSMICLLTLAATLQRAAMLLAALSITGVFWHRVQRSPHFLYACLMFLLLSGLWFLPLVVDIVQLVWHKTLEVGDNARLAEWASVIDSMDRQPASYLFGRGWGATLVTAASTYADVRYTHMLLSYTLLKTGFLGLVTLGGTLIFLFDRIIRQWPLRPVVTCAALPSVILGITLYPSFKMLCFGAILALLAITKNPESNP